MKPQYISLLSILFLVTACSSAVSPVMAEPVDSTALVSGPIIAVKTVEPTTETKNETALLDFAISPDGKKLAVYLNTGVYLYDVETLERTTFYEFESKEYYSKLNAGATIYPPFAAPGALAFSPDGSKIAISGKFQDEYISVWDLSTHKIVDYIANYPNGNYVRELEYSPSGNVLLVRSTYPKSRLQCPEQGDPPEDTLSLISLHPKNNLFEKKGCNRYSAIEFYFSENNIIYFFHFAASSLYHMDEVNTQTGNVITSEEVDGRLSGRIYDVSPNGRVFASSDGVTNLIDSITRKKLSSLDGMIDFLSDENRFLITSHGQLQLQESNKVACSFNGLEYYQTYARVSKDNGTIASLTFDKRIFQNSIQIWDIPSCKFINTIPLG